MYTKPPLGLMRPDFYWGACKVQRLADIKAAIGRYMEARLPVPESWIQEHNQLITELHKPA